MRNRCEMCALTVDAQMQLLGDLGVGAALTDGQGHVALAVGQGGDELERRLRASVGGVVGDLADQLGGDGW